MLPSSTALYLSANRCKILPMGKEQICFNCKHWALEPGALDKKHRIIAKRMAGESASVPADMYGKCKAADPPRGSLAPTPCFVYDERGNKAFEPVPIG